MAEVHQGEVDYLRELITELSNRVDDLEHRVAVLGRKELLHHGKLGASNG